MFHAELFFIWKYWYNVLNVFFLYNLICMCFIHNLSSYLFYGYILQQCIFPRVFSKLKSKFALSLRTFYNIKLFSQRLWLRYLTTVGLVVAASGTSFTLALVCVRCTRLPVFVVVVIVAVVVGQPAAAPSVTTTTTAAAATPTTRKTFRVTMGRKTKVWTTTITSAPQWVGKRGGVGQNQPG